MHWQNVALLSSLNIYIPWLLGMGAFFILTRLFYISQISDLPDPRECRPPYLLNVEIVVSETGKRLSKATRLSTPAERQLSSFKVNNVLIKFVSKRNSFPPPDTPTENVVVFHNP